MPTQSTNNNTEAKLPTGDIKVFIDAFNKDFDKKLKSLLEIQQNYKNVYADAIKITTPKAGPWPNDPKVVTIGDLFKYTFPDIESDKIVKPPDPTQYSYTDSVGWSKDLKYNKDEKIKTMYDTISRGIRSNKDINAYKALKPGITNPSLWSPGQYYFDVFMTEMLSPYGPLKKPTDANGGANAFGADVISGYSFAKTHGGSVSISFFDPSGEVELSKHRDPVDPKLDYYEFYGVLDSGYSGSGIRYIMSDITRIDINLGDNDTTAPNSFASLQTQYRSGVLSDLLQDPKFNKERGDTEDSPSGSPSTFIGYYEHILLYKAFVQAGDNYKAVVLPLRNPEPEQQAKEPEKVLAKTIEPTAIGEVQFKFNVEKTDTFIVVGGTVSPPPEFIIVPNDGTKYIMDVFNDSDDLGDEYKEGNFAGSEELSAPYDVNIALVDNFSYQDNNNNNNNNNNTTTTPTKAILMGDSLTGCLAPNTKKTEPIGVDGSTNVNNAYWGTGRSCIVFLKSINLQTIDATITHIFISMGTNDTFIELAGASVSKVVSALKSKYPIAKLYIMQGTYGSKNVKDGDKDFYGNVITNIEDRIKKYYAIWQTNGVTILDNPPIYSTVHPAVSTPGIKSAAIAIDKILSTQLTKTDNLTNISPGEQVKHLYDFIQKRVKGGYKYLGTSVYDVSQADLSKLFSITKKYGIPFEWVANLINHESAGTWNPYIRNSIGATGLIQFMTKISNVPQTYAKADGSAPVNTDTLRSMSFNMHLDYVDGFLSRGTKKRLNNNKVKREYTQTDLFMTIFYPAAVGKPDYVFPSGVQKANGGTRMPIDYTKKACSEFSPFPLVPNDLTSYVAKFGNGSIENSNVA
jgi:hypothetical protein